MKKGAYGCGDGKFVYIEYYECNLCGKNYFDLDDDADENVCSKGCRENLNEYEATLPDTLKIFVYGTLLEGYGNHYLIEDAVKIGDALTDEKYYLTADGIPFLAESPALTQIKGEVWELNGKDMVRSVDRLEGHPRWYQRKEISVTLKDGTPEKAWVYFNNVTSGSRVLEDGDYKAYRKPRV